MENEGLIFGERLMLAFYPFSEHYQIPHAKGWSRHPLFMIVLALLADGDVRLEAKNGTKK